MSSGRLIFWGLTMLIIIPVVMGFIGSTFGEEISNRETQSLPEGTVNIGEEENTGFFSGLWKNILGIGENIFSLIGLNNVWQGYTILPWWLNFVIIALPLIMLIRGLLSTSG